MSAPLEFKKIREFGEIINDTFIFVKQNFKPLLKVFIYLCGIFVLATLCSTILQQITMQKMVKSQGGFGNSGAFRSIFTLQYLLVILFGMANFAAINVSVLSYISIYIKKGNVAPTLEEVWAYFKYYFIRVLGSSVVIGIFIVICFACCILPGIYVFPAMSLIFPVMILENTSLVFSFNRSFRLISGEWMPTAGAIFIIWIITYATTSMASLPAILLTLFGVFTSGTHTMSVPIIIFSSIIQSVCQVFMVLPLIGSTLCYYNLAERKDNTGLMDRLSQLGENKNPFTDREEY